MKQNSKIARIERARAVYVAKHFSIEMNIFNMIPGPPDNQDCLFPFPLV